MPLLDVGDVKLYYTVQGDGIPIVFIHPPVLTSLNFTYQAEGLSTKYKIITFDIRGHGRSQYSKRPLTYPLIVDDIISLLDHLEIKKAFICGYSTGGSIVLEYLQSNSSRALGGIIIGGISEVKDRHLKDKISVGVKLAEIGAVPVLALSTSWTNSITKELFIQMFQVGRRGSSHNIKEYYNSSLHYNCTKQLANINLPILLVYGKKDKPFHIYAKLLHENLPYNELKFIPKVKHQIPTKAADELNRLIVQFVENYTE